MIDLENDDTIQIVDYVKVDMLTSGQLEIDDNILIADEVVSIVDIVSLPDGYTLEIVNDFGEEDETFCTYEDMFKLYVFVDEER